MIFFRKVTQCRKICRSFPHALKKLSSILSILQDLKIAKDVFLKCRKTVFLYRNPQKKTKNVFEYFPRNNFPIISFQNFLYFDSAEKLEEALYARKTLLSPKMIGGFDKNHTICIVPKLLEEVPFGPSSTFANRENLI